MHIFSYTHTKYVLTLTFFFYSVCLFGNTITNPSLFTPLILLRHFCVFFHFTNVFFKKSTFQQLKAIRPHKHKHHSNDKQRNTLLVEFASNGCPSGVNKTRTGVSGHGLELRVLIGLLSLNWKGDSSSPELQAGAEDLTVLSSEALGCSISGVCGVCCLLLSS